MAVALITLCLTFPLSGATPTVVVYPVIEFQADLPNDIRGVSLPFIQIIEEGWERERTHELQHHRQMRNLGFISFFTAYVMTAGRPFEDYLETPFMMDYPTYAPCRGLL